jgi:hypothetical protein
MPRKKRDLEEEEETTTTTAAGDELDTEDDTALSVEDRLAAIEEDLAEIKQLLSPDGQAEKDRNATMERHRKVPYIPPALPPDRACRADAERDRTGVDRVTRKKQWARARRQSNPSTTT